MTKPVSGFKELVLASHNAGKLKELQMKWFGFEMKTPKDGYLPAGAF